jgi:hypothetical protein
VRSALSGCRRIPATARPLDRETERQLLPRGGQREAQRPARRCPAQQAQRDQPERGHRRQGEDGRPGQHEGPVNRRRAERGGERVPRHPAPRVGEAGVHAAGDDRSAVGEDHPPAAPLRGHRERHILHEQSPHRRVTAQLLVPGAAKEEVGADGPGAGRGPQSPRAAAARCWQAQCLPLQPPGRARPGSRRSRPSPCPAARRRTIAAVSSVERSSRMRISSAGKRWSRRPPRPAAMFAASSRAGTRTETRGRPATAPPGMARGASTRFCAALTPRSQIAPRATPRAAASAAVSGRSSTGGAWRLPPAGRPRMRTRAALAPVPVRCSGSLRRCRIDHPPAPCSTARGRMPVPAVYSVRGAISARMRIDCQNIIADGVDGQDRAIA